MRSLVLSIVYWLCRPTVFICCHIWHNNKIYIWQTCTIFGKRWNRFSNTKSTNKHFTLATSSKVLNWRTKFNFGPRGLWITEPISTTLGLEGTGLFNPKLQLKASRTLVYRTHKYSSEPRGHWLLKPFNMMHSHVTRDFRAVVGRRFIAITRPLRYVKHRTNSKRVLITLAGAWLSSAFISSPIAFGMNYTETRQHTPHICTFYNSYNCT